jgi:phosphoglycerol transferase
MSSLRNAVNWRPTVATGALLYAVQAMVVAAIAFVILRLDAYDLRVPFNYGGDSMVILMFIKGMLLNGWTFTIPQLSAPFEMSAAAFPIMSNVDWLIMKAISLFTSEPGLVLNSFWLLTLVLSAATSTIAMQLLGVGRVHAFAAGVLYAFLPFALMRNVAHMNLVYYLVPLLGLLAVHLATGLASVNDRLIRRIAYGACIAQGFDYVYYSFFAALLFAFAAVVGYAGTRSRRVLAVAATAIGLVVASASVNLSPSIYSWASLGKPPEMTYKHPAEAETYGAKLRKMIAPHPRNPVPVLAEWGKQDWGNGYPNDNENVTARLGMAASVGFILLLMISLRAVRLPKDDNGKVLGKLAPLSLFTLLFITVGGLGAVFNLFFVSDIRAYNRFSVFLAFFALAGLGLGLRAWTPRGRVSRWLVHSSVAGLFLLGLYDQLLDCNLVAREASDTQQVRSDRYVAGHLKALYPAGASILQLPLTGFPPAYQQERMVSYDHLRPFLWSDKGMRWSWPSFSQRHRAWQERLAGARPETVLDAAVLSNFDAIWIDRSAYKDAARTLVAAFEAAGAILKFDHPGYAVLDLAQAKRQLLGRLGESEFARRKIEWLEPIRIVWGGGFYGQETTPAGIGYRWSFNRSSLIVFNDSALPRKIQLDFDVASQAPGTVVVDNGAHQWHLDSQSTPRHAALEFDMEPAAKTTLSFESTVARVKAPADSRALYFKIENFAFSELAAGSQQKSLAGDMQEKGLAADTRAKALAAERRQ